MKITINTKEDSKEEIRKVINLLSNIVNGNESAHSNTDLFSASKDVFSGTRADMSPTSDFSATTNNSTTADSTDSSSNQNAFANMFEDSPTAAKEEPAFDLANLSNLSSLREKKEEPEEEEDVQVVSY